MANKTWLRPESVPYPSVWSKFTRTNKNGEVLHFEIQDITEDLFPVCVQYMTKHFLHDEPFYTSLGFMNDQISIQEQQQWWKEILPEKLSLVCLIKDPKNPNAEPQIAGMNLLYYHHKSHDEVELKLKGEKLRAVCAIVQYLENQIDRYNLFKIEDYIDEFGLCVHPDYRGMGIATEILKARVELGKAVGFTITFTIFSAIASQKAADKAGFKNLVEMKFSDVAKHFPPYTLDVKDTPTIRYTYKLFSDN